MQSEAAKNLKCMLIMLLALLMVYRQPEAMRDMFGMGNAYLKGGSLLQMFELEIHEIMLACQLSIMQKLLL